MPDNGINFPLTYGILFSQYGNGISCFMSIVYHFRVVTKKVYIAVIIRFHADITQTA